MMPYADFNLLKFPDQDQALAKIRDLTMLTDILPDRIPRRGQGAGRRRLDGLCRRLRAGRAGGSGVGAHPGRGGRHDRRHQQGPPGAREEGRLRADRSRAPMTGWANSSRP